MITEEVLLDEIKSVLEECRLSLDSTSIYDDARDYYQELLGTTAIKPLQVDLARENLAEYYRKALQGNRAFERLSTLIDLYKKYFPNSYSECLEELQEKFTRKIQEDEDELVSKINALSGLHLINRTIRNIEKRLG